MFFLFCFLFIIIDKLLNKLKSLQLIKRGATIHQNKKDKHKKPLLSSYSFQRPSDCDKFAMNRLIIALAPPTMTLVTVHCRCHV